MALFGAKKTTTEDKKKPAKVETELKAGKPAAEKAAKKETEKKAETSMKDLYADNAAAVVKTEKGAVVNVRLGKINNHILVKPLITEKATHLNEANKYAFIVKIKANKILVAKEVAAVYGVKVEEVNMIRMKGKKVSRGKIRGRRSDFKKAIVTLAKGQTIKLYEGV